MKNKNGITLIALVITIVVLIILAGVAINLTLGENGILNKAQQAKQKQSEAESREKLEIVLSDARIEKETNTSYNSNNYLNDMLEEKGITVDGDYVIVDNYNFLIDREKLVIRDSLGETQIKVTVNVQEYLGKNANSKYEANLLLTVESNAGLQSIVITKPDGTTSEIGIEEAKTGKSMTVEFDDEYIVTVTTKDGKSTTRKIGEKSEDTIGSVAEFVAFKDKVNSGLTYEGKTINLTQDIDLSSVCGEDINGKQVSWEPIGTETNSFNGTFNGNNNIISNLYINSAQSYQGLFGYLNGTIQNVEVQGNVTAQDFNGLICGETETNSQISNCITRGKISGKIQTGGIVGRNNGAIVQYCINYAEVTGTDGAGGISGFEWTESSLIQYCANYGKITGTQQVRRNCWLC